MFFLDAHVRAREHRRRPADERGERDEEDIERVDEKLLMSNEQRTFVHHTHRQRRSREQRRETDADVGLRSPGPRTEQTEEYAAEQRNRENDEDFHFNLP